MTDAVLTNTLARALKTGGKFALGAAIGIGGGFVLFAWGASQIHAAQREWDRQNHEDAETERRARFKAEATRRAIAPHAIPPPLDSTDERPHAVAVPWSEH